MAQEYLNHIHTHIGNHRKGRMLNNSLQLVPIKNNSEYWYKSQSPGDGSCLFHSAVMLLLSDEARQDIAINIRRAISEVITLDDYSKIQNCLLALINIQLTLQNNINIDCFKTKIMSNDELKNVVDGIVSKYANSIDIVEFREKFVEDMVNVGFDKGEVEEVFKGYFISNYIEYTNILKSPHMWADHTMVLLLAEKLKINIIVISSRNMEVYKDLSTFNKDYACIVIFNTNETHFEPMVRKDNPNDEEYQTTFALDDLKSIF